MIGGKAKKRTEFERTALPHLEALYGGAFRLTRHPRDAEDLVQETVLRAYRFWDSFKKGSNCRAWLFKILTNTFINHYQKTKRRREVLERAAAEQVATDGVLVQERSLSQRDPHSVLVESSLSQDVSSALRDLPADFRTAVVLCDVEGFSYKEIADIMECPVGTVMSRLYRGRRLLKQSLREFAVREGLVKDSNMVDLDSYRQDPDTLGEIYTVMTSHSPDIDSMVIQSYLDDELDGADLAEFERLLSESPELKASVEHAEREHGALRDLLVAPRCPASLQERVALDLDAEDRRGRRSLVRKALAWSFPAASVAAAAAALVLFMTNISEQSPGESGVAHEAVRQRIRTPAPTPVVNRPSRTEVSASLTRYFSSPISAPRFAAAGILLDAWRPSQLNGREAAELRYTVSTRTGRHVVTLHLFDALHLELRGTRQLTFEGQTLWLDQPFGFSAVSYKDAQSIAYVFTSDMSERELVELVVSSDILHRAPERFR